MVLTTISAIFAPGPLVMSTILSASRIASSTSWVIMNTVCWVSAQMRSTSSCSMPRVSASSALNGSSISSILGWMESARAMPTRCFMPPESCAGRLPSAPFSPTSSMNLRAWSWTLARSHDGQREETAKAMLPMTVSQGSSAWPWKITARSRLGPSISRLSTITVPSLGRSSPASTFRIVVLPQPEWPIRQTNSPRSMPSHRFSNTAVSPKRRARPSTLISGRCSMALFRIGHELGEPRQALVEQQADQADQQDRRHDVGDREVVPLVPHEVADARAAHQHLGRHDHQPGDADRDAHAGHDGGRGRRQDDLEGGAQGADLERARHVQPFAPHARHAEGGVYEHRPHRADEDHEDRGDGAVLDGVEGKRHPGGRRPRPPVE